MSIPHAKSGEIIQLRLGAALSNSKTTSLVKTAELELIRMILPAGKQIAPHRAPGLITVQCLEGCIAFTTEAQTQELAAGQMLYVRKGEVHSLMGIADSSVLVTILLSKD